MRAGWKSDDFARFGSILALRAPLWAGALGLFVTSCGCTPTQEGGDAFADPTATTGPTEGTDTSPPDDPPPPPPRPPGGGPDPCGNGVQDGSETDVDCGGPDCWLCTPGQGCGEDLDCSTLFCDGGRCAATACDDGLRNGRESGRDCGGPDCSPCEDGLGCILAEDCRSGICREGICAPPDCTEDAQCEDLFGTCGFGICDRGRCARRSQPDGTPCNDDCSLGVCSIGACVEYDRLECEDLAGLCEVARCNPERVGCDFDPLPDGEPCGTPCFFGGQCLAGECEGLTRKDCSALDGPCTAGACDNTSEETRGDCIAIPANEGGICDDGNPSTTDDRCLAGTCVGTPPAP